MSDWELQARCQAFMHEYAASLDEERFDDWVALFDAEECTYEVLSRENRDLGLPAPIMGCYTHGMVRDRVAMLAKGVLTYRRDRLLRQVTNVQCHSQGEAVRPVDRPGFGGVLGSNVSQAGGELGGRLL